VKVIKLITTGSCMSVITTLIDPTTAEGSSHIFQANLRGEVVHLYFSIPEQCDLGKLFYFFSNKLGRLISKKIRSKRLQDSDS
jgi:hypothetical protein